MMCFSLVACYTCGLTQSVQSPVDTVSIFKEKSGISFRIYMHTWFFEYGIQNTYSYDYSKFNKQDSLAITSHPPRYFKVYDSRERLWFEGGTKEHDEYLTGDIQYYFKSGELKHIEHLDGVQVDCICSGPCYGWNDGQGPEGTWKYFRKDGTVKKQVEYTVQVKSCEQEKFRYARKISHFNKSGTLKHVRYKKAWKWKGE